MNDCSGEAGGRRPQAVACPNASKKSGLLIVETHTYDTGTPMWAGPCVAPVLPLCYRVAVSTSFAALAARLFLRLLEIVRSMTAPQLMHFHA